MAAGPGRRGRHGARRPRRPRLAARQEPRPAARRDRRRRHAARRHARDDQGLRHGPARHAAGLRRRGSREPRPLLRGPRAKPRRRSRPPPSSTTSGSPGRTRSAGRTSSDWPTCARRCGRSTRRAAGITRRSSSPTISSPFGRRSPDRPDDWQTQLTLMTSRAKAITLLRGYSAEAEDAYAEAFALVKEHGEVPQLFPVLRNLASFHGYRGELDKAIALRHGDPRARRRHRRRGHAGLRSTRSSARTPGSPVTSRPASATSTRRSPRSRAATSWRAGCAWAWTRGCRA